MNEFFIPFGNIFSLFRSKVKGLYPFALDIISGSTQFNTFTRDREKLAMVLSNPAVLKVFALQCNLFSMGKVTVVNAKTDEPVDNDPFLDLLSSPNPFTKTESQFLWDFMFWNMLGTSYCYVDSAVLGKRNKMYFLDPSKIEWPQELERKKDKMIFSDAELKDIMKTTITYRYADGTTFEFPFDRLVITHDLTNSAGNWFKGSSRLDALYKIVSNSEYTLDADNINIRYSGKFLVGSDKAVGASIKVGMSNEEKDDITSKIDTDKKSVWPLQSMVKIQRFVSDMANLELSEKYLHLYFVIGNMFDIPRDVLEAYTSATYENQEKARAAHVDYTLSPKGNQFMDSYEMHFGYKAGNKNIRISWDHLPFVQIFAKQKVETKKIEVEVLNSLLALGVSLEQANKYLGTEFEIEEPPEQPSNEQAGQEVGQGQAPEGEGQEAEGTTDAADSQKIRFIR